MLSASTLALRVRTPISIIATDCRSIFSARLAGRAPARVYARLSGTFQALDSIFWCSPRHGVTVDRRSLGEGSAMQRSAESPTPADAKSGAAPEVATAPTVTTTQSIRPIL